MPDYALIQPLCENLGISVSELIEGKKASLNEQQLMDLLSGILLSLSVGILLIGLYMIFHALSKQ